MDTACQALYALGLAYLRSAEADSARAVYARAVERFGRGEGRRLGADADLRWLTSHGEQEAVAREILNRYWP